MNSSNTRRYDMFLRVHEFDTIYATHFPADSLGRQLFDRLKNVIDSIETLAQAQYSGMRAAKESSNSKGVAEDELNRAL